ncbi:MAG: YheC/YheD family protein [Paenibacillaceae bacterium]
MKRPYVGVLVNQRLFKGIEQGKTAHESLYHYVLAGNEYKVVPCFFRLGDIRPGQPTVRAYVSSGLGFIRKEVPTPRIIHNRAMYRRSISNKKLERLTRNGMIIFNQFTRYYKYRIHQILLQDSRIRVSLPETEIATIDSIKGMMSRHHTLILKPNNGSIGKGIMKLEKSAADSWTIFYRGNSQGNYRQYTFRSSLPLFLRHAIAKQSYLVQQRLPLAEFEGHPYDFRVSVQRDRTGDWTVTGIVGKAAANRSFITNVAQGGKVHPLETIIRSNTAQSSAYVREQLTQFSLSVARHLSLHLPYLADIGLDVGITPDGFPLFIECNCKDLRYSFRKAGLIDEWVNTYRNPIGYAKYLLEQHKQI